MSALPAGYRLSLMAKDADPVAAHAFLTTSYWSPGISLETVERAMANSIVASVHDNSGQVGMARAVSDLATFAYLADVYVLASHRGKGLASAMVAALQAHPQLQGLRRWLLFTKDAHGVYARLGWQPCDHPERVMLRETGDALP